MEPKKKPFPKTKKKIRGFLTDESMNMSKKSVLGLAVGSVLLYTGVNNVYASDYHINNCPPSSCSTVVGNANCACLGTATTSSFVGGPVNGHFSQGVGEYGGIPTLGHSQSTSHVNTYRPRVNKPASHSNTCIPSCSAGTGNRNCACPNSTPTTVHKSGIVNGAFNSTITQYGTPSVAHSSHSNHGNGGWC